MLKLTETVENKVHFLLLDNKKTQIVRK